MRGFEMKKVLGIVGVAVLAFVSTAAWADEDAAIAITVRGKPGYAVDEYFMDRVLDLNADLMRKDLVDYFHVYVRSKTKFEANYDHGFTYCLGSRTEPPTKTFNDAFTDRFRQIQAEGIPKNMVYDFATGLECPQMKSELDKNSPAIEVDLYGIGGYSGDEHFVQKVLDLNAALIQEDLVDDFHVIQRVANEAHGFAFCLRPRTDPPTKSFEDVLQRFEGIGEAPAHTKYELKTVKGCED